MGSLLPPQWIQAHAGRAGGWDQSQPQTLPPVRQEQEDPGVSGGAMARLENQGVGAASSGGQSGRNMAEQLPCRPAGPGSRSSGSMVDYHTARRRGTALPHPDSPLPSYLQHDVVPHHRRRPKHPEHVCSPRGMGGIRAGCLGTVRQRGFACDHKARCVPQRGMGQRPRQSTQ